MKVSTATATAALALLAGSPAHARSIGSPAPRALLGPRLLDLSTITGFLGFGNGGSGGGGGGTTSTTTTSTTGTNQQGTGVTGNTQKMQEIMNCVVQVDLDKNCKKEDEWDDYYECLEEAVEDGCGDEAVEYVKQHRTHEDKECFEQILKAADDGDDAPKCYAEQGRQAIMDVLISQSVS